MNPMKAKRFTEWGAEIPDSTPIEIASELQKPAINLFESIREALRSEKLREAAMQSGEETFEEADDFDVGDDMDPMSQWEGDFDTPLEVLIDQYRQRLEATRAGEVGVNDVPPPPGEMDRAPSRASSKKKVAESDLPPGGGNEELDNNS